MFIPNLASENSCRQHENNIKKYEELKGELQQTINNDEQNSELNNRVMNEILKEMNDLMKSIEGFRDWYGYDLEFNGL